MNALVSVPIYLDLELSNESYDIELESSEEHALDLDTAIVVTKRTEEEYQGPYIVEPSQEEQTLPTKDKVLRKDVTVLEVQMGLATTRQIDRLF